MIIGIIVCLVSLFTFFLLLAPGFLLVLIGGLMISWGGKLRKGKLQKKIAKVEYKIKYGKVDKDKGQHKIDKLKVKLAKYT